MRRRLILVVSLCVAISFLVLTPARAQYNGHNTKGDFGLMSGSQPPPGFYRAPIYVRYGADTLRIEEERK